VAGIIVAGIAHGAAKATGPCQRGGAASRRCPNRRVVVAIGAVLVLAFGLWLVDLRGHSLGETWIGGALTVFVLALVLGALGGRRPRQARVLASQLAQNDDAVSHELRRLREDRASALANYAAVVAVVAILALMVWQPS
jgi:uncharacterized membrane protein